ncbi:MAG: hydroxymethylbilane synthase [Saprospiraceae bacterium]|nr:hydroxymethylbilane synthase [Pyrinomonadaceae bacterium]
MPEQKLIIGTRGSDLAMWQSNFVASELQKHFPDLSIEIKIIHTTGDKIVDVALAKIGDKGLFTRQIENALLDGEIDLAVHSLKDLQTVQPEGLIIGTVLEREVSNDVLISKKYDSIDELPHGAKVATGSLRRRSQLLNFRPDLQIFDIRGNVPTRLEKFAASDLDAMILAYAGLHRLGLDSHIKQIIPFDIMLPAVGQGAVAVEIRDGDNETSCFVEKLGHAVTQICVTAERSFLRTIEGGCQVPVGAVAWLDGGTIHLEGMAGNLDGSVNLRETISGPKDDADGLGMQLGLILIEKGSDKLLAEARTMDEAGETSASMKTKVVLVIREDDDFSSILRQSGFEVLNLPLIHTEPVEDLVELDIKLGTLDKYDGIFLTSPVAAAIFLERVNAFESFVGKFYVLGERTKSLFDGKNVDLAFSKNANTAKEFISSFETEEFTGKNFLFMRGDKSMRTIPWLLRTSAVVDEVVVYRTVENPVSGEMVRNIEKKIEGGEIDWICFFSPSAIDAFVNLFSSDEAKIINTAVIGETTANRARETGMNLQLISKKANAADFANSLAEQVKQSD